MNLLIVLAVGLTIGGTGGDEQLLVFVVLLPGLVGAVIGNVVMMAYCLGLCLLLSVGILVEGGTASGPSVLVTAILFVGITLVVRNITLVGLNGFTMALTLTHMMETSGSSEDPIDGLNRILDGLAFTTGASQIWLVAVDHDGKVEPVLAYPDPEAKGWDEEFDFRGALDDAWVVTSRNGGAISAGQLGGKAIALVVRRRWERIMSPDVRTTLLGRAATPVRLLLERTSLIERLRLLSTIDELTGLPNRRELMDRLRVAVAGANRTGTPLCVAMLDLDHFKDYNDSFGHLAGDEVLRSMGALLSARLRVTDVPTRYGGEEFAIVLPNTDTGGATSLLTDLLDSVRGISAQRQVTFSAGVAELSGGESIDELLHRADVALYAAKRSGRQRVERA